MWRFTLASVLAVATSLLVGVGTSVGADDNAAHLITVYDRGTTRAFISEESTIGDALRVQGIELDARDTVEPSTDEELVASEYYVNIYRARPVMIVDGSVRVKTISPYQTAEQIAKSVGITLYEGDGTFLTPLTDFVYDGAGLQLTIKRSTPFIFDLFGKKTKTRTQGATVAEMLKEKGITLTEKDRVSPRSATKITKGMTVRVWREGKQTISVDEEIPMGMRIVYDADRPIGYRAQKTQGEPGVRTISYEIEVKDGEEISRKEIANIVAKKPTTQVDVIGIYNDGSGLTEARGAQYFTDKNGVSHRETYYDLDMSVVMQSCGQGGYYSVRPDGAKVDRQGYIIVAANYGNYPKCTIVETSLGPAKVYDTGGFALRHPHGFDLATDWSYPDGI